MLRFAQSACLIAVLIPLGSIEAQARVTGGITAGSFSWEDGRREEALGIVLQIAPAPWLLVGAVPAVLRAHHASSSGSQIGLADLPVYAALVHTGTGPAHPTLTLAASASLPTGDSDRGLGRGFSSYSGELAVGIDPAPGLTVRGGASRLLRVAGSAPSGMATTSIFGDVVLGTGSSTNLSLGAFGELRGGAPAQYDPARSINAAISHRFRSGSTLLLGAGHTVAGAGPRWSFSIGIGTAFGGVSPVGATGPLARGRGGLAPLTRQPATPLCTIAEC